MTSCIKKDHMTLRPEIIIKENSVELARTGADIFTGIAKDCVSNDGCFTAAVSGGSTPRTMHRLLAQKPFLSEIPWEKTHIFWVDDRCVPYDDPASNYGAAKADLLDSVPIPENNVHPVPVDIPPEEGAMKYQDNILSHFNSTGSEVPVFDLVILGIGTDGHTASLFPGHKELDEKDRLVTEVEGGNPFVHRLTMTLPLLNNARKTVFLASGPGKADIVKEIFNNKNTGLPAQLIRPVKGNLTWLMDRKAARLITG